MKRRPVIVLLVCSLFLHGCATQKAMLPANSDPNQLAGEIAHQGQTDGSTDEKPVKQTVDSRCIQWSLTTVAVVAVVVVVVAGVAIYAIASGKSGNNSSL